MMKINKNNKTTLKLNKNPLKLLKLFKINNKGGGANDLGLWRIHVAFFPQNLALIARRFPRKVANRSLLKVNQS